MWVMPSAPSRELGKEYGASFLNKLSDAPSLVYEIVERFGIDCEAVRNGTLHCASNAAGLRNIRERAKQWQALGG